MILGQVRGRDSLAVQQASIILIARGNLGVSKVSQIFTQQPSAVIFFLRHVSISVARKDGQGTYVFLFQPLYTALFSHQQQQHKGSQTIFLVRAIVTSPPGLNEHESEVQQP